MLQARSREGVLTTFFNISVKEIKKYRKIKVFYFPTCNKPFGIKGENSYTIFCSSSKQRLSFK